jgi:hypothetical protein
VVSLLLLLALPAVAAHGHKVTLRGVLVDVACATERANDLAGLRAKHTRKCLQMPECDKSGFALLTADDRVLRFDDAGNARARQLIAATERETQWQVTVSGRLDGDTLAVRKLALVP